MIDFPSAKNKFTFYLDRKAKRVTIDINSNSQMFSKHLNAPSLNESTTIRSLAFTFSENTISLSVDCKSVVKDEMEFNLSKLFLNMEEPTVKLLRERKYPLFLDRTFDSAMTRANCQKSSKQKPNRKMIKDSDSYGYFNGKRGGKTFSVAGIFFLFTKNEILPEIATEKSSFDWEKLIDWFTEEKSQITSHGTICTNVYFNNLFKYQMILYDFV